MKKLMLLFFLISVTSCTKKSPNYYHGVVVDKNHFPISGVEIKERLKYPQSTISRNDGYFKLYKSPTFTADLIFIKKGFNKETILTTWSQHGETLETTFLDKIPDTVVLRKKETIPH